MISMSDMRLFRDSEILTSENGVELDVLKENGSLRSLREQNPAVLGRLEAGHLKRELKLDILAGEWKSDVDPVHMSNLSTSQLRHVG